MIWTYFFDVNEQALIRRAHMLDREGRNMVYPDKDSVVAMIQCCYGDRLATEIAGNHSIKHEFIYTYINNAGWEEIKRIAEMRPESVYMYMKGV